MHRDGERPGFYQDRDGQWHPDRRSGKERRGGQWWEENDARRQQVRRQVDRELIERDHKRQIEEALEDFAEEHNGRL
jgi:hypothetical protein